MFIGVGLINSAPIQANNMSNDILISQSRRQYECTRNGVNPTISGSLFSDGYNCLIPEVLNVEKSRTKFDIIDKKTK
jgi:hypothetical protein